LRSDLPFEFSMASFYSSAFAIKTYDADSLLHLAHSTGFLTHLPAICTSKQGQIVPFGWAVVPFERCPWTACVFEPSPGNVMRSV
jgi:hypothetical protein